MRFNSKDKAIIRINYYLFMDDTHIFMFHQLTDYAKGRVTVNPNKANWLTLIK